nr:triple tyrosine motif-containing protein [Dyella sp. ASV21]
MADGSVWINGNAGAVHIQESDIDRAIKDPAYKAAARVFSNDDGVAGGAQQVRPLPSLVQGSDGRLWFASSTGLSWVDPKTLDTPKAPPALYIRSVVAGNTVYSPSLPVKLPARTRDLTINYTVLGTSSPRRQAFRYKMAGLNQSWQDVGPRREAVYSNLGPGHYEFVLQAANEDGVWNLQGTSLAFDIAPAFYEAWWFKVIIVACVLLGGWLAYVARLRYIKQSIRDRLSARHAERDRIARDLHDTLLQAMQGLLLRLQVWAIHPTLDEGQRKEVDSFARYARDMLVDGRNRILQLRRESDSGEGLEDLLNGAIMESASETSAAIRLVVEGPLREVDAEVLPDVVDIAREAIRNAARHARAGSIHVHVVFSPKALKVAVRDDGCGIDEACLRSGGRPEHWGLRGMRERAKRISSSISVGPGAQGGTLVELAVPARLAYAG